MTSMLPFSIPSPPVNHVGSGWVCVFDGALNQRWSWIRALSRLLNLFVLVQRIRAPQPSPSGLPRLTSRRARVWSSTAWPLETPLLESPGRGPAGCPPTTRWVQQRLTFVGLELVPKCHSSAVTGCGQSAENPFSHSRGRGGVYLPGAGQPWKPLISRSPGHRLRVRHLIFFTCVLETFVKKRNAVLLHLWCCEVQSRPDLRELTHVRWIYVRGVVRTLAPPTRGYHAQVFLCGCS